MSDITRDVMKMKIENLFLYYEGVMALKDINMKIPNKSVTALIGPSGCGKSSLLRCLNRMNDFVPNAKVEGRIYLDDTNIYSPGMDLIELRKKVGMVFQ
ncbi:ATP-binding cassette domain-containing protein, partial [Acetomicrobium sp. UBA5826]|uniref:ATP-binding cassette domain-containing protein n=1 Tax=Acetomicrobium sp. UBA5826 TaxID=1946039 RepID=UPI00258028AD